MSTKTKSPFVPTTALLLVNLIPLAGILVLDWDPRLVLALYWFEFAVVILLNVPKIMLAEADRTGRLPDDIQLSPEGPSIRLGKAWLAVASLVIYGTFFLVITRGSPIWDTLTEVMSTDAELLTVGTVVLAVAAMAGSHLFKLQHDFIGNEEYTNVTPEFQTARLVGQLWLFLAVLVFAGGIQWLETNPTFLAAILILVKGTGDVAASQLLGITSPTVAPFSRETSPEESPEWTGTPSIRPLLVVHGLIFAVAAPIATLLTVGIYGGILLDLLKWPFYATVMFGGFLAISTVGLWLFGLAVIYYRYRYLEYRVYSHGLCIYNTRHETIATYIPAHKVSECMIYRGIFGRIFGTGVIRVRMNDTQHAGRWTLQSDIVPGQSARVTSDDEEMIQDLPSISDPESVRNQISWWQ